MKPKRKAETCICGHSRDYHRFRDADDSMVTDGPCQKCDWGLSSSCDCQSFTPTTPAPMTAERLIALEADLDRAANFLTRLSTALKASETRREAAEASEKKLREALEIIKTKAGNHTTAAVTSDPVNDPGFVGIWYVADSALAALSQGSSQGDDKSTKV